MITLSEIEDNNIELLIAIIKEAGRKAVEENKALNIPNTCLQDGWVVRKYNNGTIEKLVKLNKPI